MIASRTDSEQSGLKYLGAEPPTSGNDDEFEQATAHPANIASRIGIPKPSYKDGYTKQVAWLYNILSSFFDTKPFQQNRPGIMLFNYLVSSAENRPPPTQKTANMGKLFHALAVMGKTNRAGNMIIHRIVS